MTTLAETKDNQGLIDEYSLGAVSDLVRACPEWVEKRMIGWNGRTSCRWAGLCTPHLRGVSHQRHALAGAIYHRLWALAQESMTGKDATLFLKRRVGELVSLPQNYSKVSRRNIDVWTFPGWLFFAFVSFRAASYALKKRERKGLTAHVAVKD